MFFTLCGGMETLGAVVKGSFSALLSTVTISSRVFFVGSPACNEWVVVEGGAVRIVIISVSACLKKSPNLTCGNEMAAGFFLTVRSFHSVS